MGCQMNEYDSVHLSRILEDSGYAGSRAPEEADIVLVNTCSVRAKAEQKALSRLGRLVALKRKHPGLLVAVAGCVAQQRGSDLFQRFPGLDLVLGPREIGRFKEVWTPLAELAKAKGVRIAFENCNMGGTWQSGDWNIAHNPLAWELMFDAIPLDNLGLEWEPCHQMVALIDPIPQLQEWVKRIYHLHGKDATIDWPRIRKYGIFSAFHEDIAIKTARQVNRPFAFHRTPGFGDSDWTRIITELRLGGFKGSIDIEGWHDPVYRGDLEMTGQVKGLLYLKQCRGAFVPNPKE